MPFGPGWSPSDLVLLIQLIYGAYDTIKNVPDEYQDLLEKFKDIERELNVLEERLAEVGKERYGTFHGAAELRKDLEGANEHLKQFEALNRKGFLKKVVSTTRFTFDSRRTLRYSHRMDIHRTRLHDFRQDIILQATLSQLNSVRGTTNLQGLPEDVIEAISSERPFHDEISILSSDHASVLNQARKSVNLAKDLNRAASGRPKQRLRTIPSESSDLDGLESGAVEEAIHEFVDNVVARAEASKLYLKTTVPETHIEEFTAIAEWLDRIQKLVGESPKILPAKKEPNSAPLDPPIVGEFRLQTNLSHSQSDLNTWWASLPYLNTNDLESFVKESGTSAPDTLTPSPSKFDDGNDTGDSDGDDLSVATETTSLPSIYSPALEPIHFRSSTFICNPSTGNYGMKCNLEISRLEGSICIWAKILGRMIPMSSDDGALMSLTPQAHLELPRASSTDSQTWRPMVLIHSTKPGLDSFPAVLHPTVEAASPNDPRAPYEIDFYNAQCLDVEGRTRTTGRIKGYKYIFASREDRDIMREHLFGKTLLFTAGYEESSASSCRIQALTLWRTSSMGKTSITITLPGRSRKIIPPDYTLEFQVLSCENLHKAAREGQELVLKVQLVNPNPFDDGSSTRRQSMVSTSTSTSDSGSTLRSKFSTRTRSARLSSTQIEMLRIKLSDATSSEKRDKKIFLRKLSEIFELG